MKRFTETAKWSDPWFCGLPAELKLAWLYLLDNCDAAGVIDLNRPLADFQIGHSVAWESFLESAGDRVAIIAKGKIWLTGFVRFQYGELRDTNNLHRSVLRIVESHGLVSGDAQGITVPSAGDQVKVKVKEQVKVKVNPEGGCKGETVELPNEIDTEPMREAVGNWLAYKRERKESYRPTGLKAFYARIAKAAAADGPLVVIGKLERAMASGWTGWDHDEAPSRGSPRNTNDPRGNLALRDRLLAANKELFSAQ